MKISLFCAKSSSEVDTGGRPLESVMKNESTWVCYVYGHEKHNIFQ